jgi:hypothetical protein
MATEVVLFSKSGGNAVFVPARRCFQPFGNKESGNDASIYSVNVIHKEHLSVTVHSFGAMF